MISKTLLTHVIPLSFLLVLTACAGQHSFDLDRKEWEKIKCSSVINANLAAPGLFERIDADENDIITKKEFLEFWPYPSADEIFTDYDFNKDNQITPEEIKTDNC